MLYIVYNINGCCRKSNIRYRYKNENTFNDIQTYYNIVSRIGRESRKEISTNFFILSCIIKMQSI